MSQALYRKWRPQTWEAVIGQPHVISTLRNALAAGRVAHAYLFAGPRGTGKTTTARLLAKAVNCLEEDLSIRPCGKCEPCLAVSQGRFLDLIEIDAASNTSVDDVRDLRDKINFAPNQGRYKVYIIDEVHMLSTAAFNALLKTLEEPPPHAIFILATTEVHKIPATVLSRCQRHEFRRIPLQEIVAQLTQMSAEEGIQAEPEALTLIARQSTGAMRDAISLLDQLASTGKKITLEMAQNVLGAAASQSVLAVVEALIARQAGSGLDRIHEALDGGSDARQLTRQIVDYLRDVLLIKLGDVKQVDGTAEVKALMEQHARQLSASELLRLIRIFNYSAGEARNAWQPSLPLELAFVEALESLTNAAESVPTGPTTSGQNLSRASTKTAISPPTKAQATPPASETSDETAPASGSADAQANKRLAEAWPQILHLVRQQSQPAYATLNSSTSRLLSGNHLTLSFASNLLKGKMERPENLSLLQNALKQVLGRELMIRCVVDTTRRDSVPQGVDEDGMVAAALRDLGGELVDIN